MLREDIKSRVKAKLEEYSPFDDQEELVAIPTSEVKPIDSYIEDSIDVAYDDILLAAPLHLIKETMHDMYVRINEGIEIKDEVGYYDIPADFLRLHTVVFDNWERASNYLMQPSDPRYILQRNRYTRGKTAKPVVATNNNRFEIYSVIDNATCTAFKYIPITELGKSEFEDSLADMLVIQTSILVLEIFEQYDKVQALTAELENLIKSKSI